MTPTSIAGPAEGLAWRPGRSGNAVTWDGRSVVKRHAGGSVATLRELGVLARVAELPVPRVQSGTNPSALRLDFVPGIPAVDAIESGRATDVLAAIGRALRRVQSIDVRHLGAATPTGVVSHGDFAPYNILVSPDTCDVLAIVDWEAADVRDPLADLAWCEWQFQRLFPRHAYAVAKLFDGYGETPQRSSLADALEGRMQALSKGEVSNWSPGDPRRYRVTFDDRDQAAGFVAALSRAVNTPLRVGPLAPPCEIWSVATPHDVPDVYLNRTAMETAMAVFQAAGGEQAALPPDATLVFLAGHTASMGIDEALSRL